MRELDDKLSDEELDGMIAEIDSDGSGTVDFDGEFDMQSGSWIKLNLIFFCIFFLSLLEFMEMMAVSLNNMKL